MGKRDTPVYGLSRCSLTWRGFQGLESSTRGAFAFRFEEISEIPRTQWNGTFRLHRPEPSHHAFGYCSCKQDTKERYWGQQF